MVDFGGWDMPVEYSGLISEHLAVRNGVGVFDVSHMGEIEIREADFSDAADAAAIVTVLDSYASDPVGGGEPLSADVRDRLVAALSEQSNALVLLAWREIEPVGLAVCFYGFSTFRARPLLNVHDLAVIPGYRGRGIGRKLLTDAETRARARGC